MVCIAPCLWRVISSVMPLSSRSSQWPPGHYTLLRHALPRIARFCHIKMDTSQAQVRILSKRIERHCLRTRQYRSARRCRNDGPVAHGENAMGKGGIIHCINQEKYYYQLIQHSSSFISVSGTYSIYKCSVALCLWVYDEGHQQHMVVGGMTKGTY